ncbi:MAG: PEGA domain-containing protein [Deltaproteobacteria bacterium]|nr:PEGA domain-containing protein [Deltaproteobacteria bacterium]
MRRLAPVLVLLSLAAGSLVPRTARAQPAPAPSPTSPAAPAPAPSAAPAPVDEDKRKGDEASAELRYMDAIGHYERSYAATKNPAVLYNMGRAYQSLADFPKALDKLEEFAEKAPPDLKARVPQLDALLAEVRGRVATVIISAQVSGAEIRLGDKILGKTKVGQTILRVNAGPQTLTVRHPDYFESTRALTLAAGKVETADVVLTSRAQEALVTVTSPVSGANVSMDGRAIGVVPAQTGAKPGQHRITLTRDGYDPAETSIVVKAGEDRQVSVPMATHETITSKWWFWTGIGVIVAGGVVATIVIVNTEKDPTSGTIPPGTVKAESFGFRF